MADMMIKEKTGRLRFCILLLSLFVSFFFTASRAQQDEKKAWVFCYFKGNGEDGLHLAYSMDGYNWKALKNDSSFLRPAAGKDKLMRDTRF